MAETSLENFLLMLGPFLNICPIIFEVWLDFPDGSIPNLFSIGCKLWETLKEGAPKGQNGGLFGKHFWVT